MDANHTMAVIYSGSGTLANRLVNPGFENGPVNWVNYSSGGYQDITNSAQVAAHSGSWLAWLGGADNLTEYIYQDVPIPTDATQAYVQFWYYITTSDFPSSCYDSLTVEIRRPNDNALLATLATLCNYNQTSQWTLSGQFNVLAFKGQTIRLRLIGTTDFSEPSNFYLDDLSLITNGTFQRFTDVPPTHPYFAYVERIGQLGVTSGCTPTGYCPDGVVTRDQMAVFIERVLGIFNPPTPSSQRFVEVPPGYWAYAFIGDFATRGITAGCSLNEYCPGNLVSRDQMAVFMERASGRFSWPTTPFQRFSDVPLGWWSYAAIDSFVANNSSRGIMDVIKRDCNPDGLHFCPSRPLTRGEMAAWLVIAFNL